MALLVWGPFTQNCNNQGLAAIQFSGVSTSNLIDGGKLGKCYNLPTNGSFQIGSTAQLFSAGQDWTIACWVKLLSYPSQRGDGIICSNKHSSQQTTYNGTTYNGGGFGVYILSNGNLKVFANSASGECSHDTTINLSLNTWYHVCVTYRNKQFFIYKNGILSDTWTADALWTLNGCPFMFGIGSQGGWEYRCSKNLNDVRIYNECLSAKEVKEISKGLIVHYPFNWGNANLLKLGAAERQCPSQSAIMQHYYFDFAGNLPTATYTLSFDAKNNGTDAAYFSVARGDSTQTRIGELHPGHNHYAHYSYTFTTTSTAIDNVFFTAYKSYGSPTNANNTGILYIKNVKLESGNIETPFEIAASEGYTNNNLYDISGYNHNATLSGSGDLLISNITPRYKSAVGFQASRYYQCVSPSSSVQTIAVWAKWIMIPSGQSVIYVDNKSRTGLGLMSTGILTSSQITSSTFNKSSIVANTWYHFVIVCPNGPTDSARELYINGVKQTASSSTSSWSFSIDQLNIGKRSSTNDGFNGYLSDFRMYATALSATDVKELYETSMEVDASGNITPRILTT